MESKGFPLRMKYFFFCILCQLPLKKLLKLYLMDNNYASLVIKECESNWEIWPCLKEIQSAPTDRLTELDMH